MVYAVFCCVMKVCEALLVAVGFHFLKLHCENIFCLYVVYPCPDGTDVVALVQMTEAQRALRCIGTSTDFSYTSWSNSHAIKAQPRREAAGSAPMQNVDISRLQKTNRTRNKSYIAGLLNANRFSSRSKA